MDQPDDVAAVVLAAGESRRFGSPKQLALLEGRTLLEHVLEAARGAGLRPVAAVVPVWLSQPASSAAADDLIWLRNPEPGQGMSHSLRLGLEALPPNVGAAVVLLGDEPRVRVDHLRALVAARGARPIVASDRHGLLAPPVLLERDAFARVAALAGDVGLRDLIRGAPGLVAAVRMAALADVDTPDDLRRDGRR